MKKTFQTVAITMVAILSSACVGATTPPRRMSVAGLPGAASSYLAKELCSCLFVTKRPEAFCLEYTKQSPGLATPTIEWNKREVYTAVRYASRKGYGLYPRTARWISDQEGCVLEN